MQTIEIKGAIYAYRSAIDDSLMFIFAESELGHGWFRVCDHKIVAELPAGFDPRAAEVAGLEREREKVRAEMTMRITEINERIQSLLAIEHRPSEVAA
ncbi:hypothetical protein EM868_09150 [Cupriavidus gilardii]|uniref:hypothetical protein n=1 Tax=Cupriavidus gilardii TaxID=82541 RepID=UPI001EE597E0|nr:hypothetical protein [Cupriavidus gilardii]MCG5259778.1 hypothetical protein [Cupriavidus gilardii]MDF9429963.1 hypothetical protein [Cupriavidus gilardii]